MNWENWGSWGRKKRKYNRFWSSSKKREAIYESKNFGLDFVRQKYGNDRVSQILKDIEKSTLSPGRGHGQSKYTNQGGDGPGHMQYVRGRGRVKVGDSSWNRPRKIDPTKHDPLTGLAVGGRFSSGGPPPVVNQPPTEGNPPFEPGSFKPRTKLNLENDEELAQGYQHEWAQPTSISSTITGLLRQSQNSSSNYWEQWAQDKGGQYAVDARDSSSFGMDLRWTPESAPTSPALQSAMSNPMGAFGVQGTYSGFPAETTPPESLPPISDPDRGNPVPPYANPTLPPNANPWGFGYGAETNSYGPSGQTMANSTLEAMSLANAYFAPQRMELAYELGDMETDMRRLAVNLGRQTDDPVLQAKLYKEAMRSVRTLDVQQNTFAFQMAEQRRREELQNFQFYDQLAMEEYKMRQQMKQFYEQLEIQREYYNLDLSKFTNSLTPPTTPTAPPSTTPSTPAGAPAMIQRQWAQPKAYVPPMNLNNMAGSLLGLNPYSSSMGGALVNRSQYPV